MFPGSRHQRCWFHKISNVLNRFPKSMSPAVTSGLQDIHHAETKAAALAATEVFTEKYGVKYSPAVACLTRDTGALLTFFDVPAEHRDHLRTSNPVESVFATARPPPHRPPPHRTARHRTVRHRTARHRKARHRKARHKGCLVAKNRKADSLLPHTRGIAKMAPPQRCKSGATRPRRHHSHRANRQKPTRQNQRRLIRSVTQNQA